MFNLIASFIGYDEKTLSVSYSFVNHETMSTRGLLKDLMLLRFGLDFFFFFFGSYKTLGKRLDKHGSPFTAPRSPFFFVAKFVTSKSGLAYNFFTIWECDFSWKLKIKNSGFIPVTFTWYFKSRHKILCFSWLGRIKFGPMNGLD